MTRDSRTRYPFVVTYETAVMSRWPTESDAWAAHDVAVIAGLNPDKLAVLRLREVA